MNVRVEGRLVSRSRREMRVRYLVATAMASVAALAVVFEVHAPYAAMLVTVSVFLAYYAITEGGRTPPRSAAITVDQDIVDIDGVRTKKSAVASAHREQGRVAITLANGDEHVLQASPAEAEGLVEALGFGPGGRVVRLVVGGYRDSRMQKFAAMSAAVLVVVAMPLVLAFLASVGFAIVARREDELLAAMLLALPAVGAAALAIGLSRAVRRTTVDIGGDGVRVAVGVQRPRALPFDRLDAKIGGRDVRLASGVDDVAVRCASEAEATMLLRALEDARAGRMHADIDVTSLVRGADDVETWRARLRALLSGSGYRNVLGPDDLARVVEDATAAPEARVGAAVALSSLGESAPELARVRVAIEGVVSPHLRIALDRAAAGDIDEDALDAATPDAEKV